jgi:cytochrome b561
LDEQNKYSGLMIAMHWLMAIGIVTAFGAGLYMVSIEGITPFKLRLYNWHKWLGVTLFVLVGARIVIKLMNKQPAYPRHWGRNAIRMAKAGHWALYLLMFAVPTFGYLFSLAAGYPVVWFGVIELPVLIEKNAEMKDLYKLLHELSANLLVLLVVGHVGMVIKHQVKDRENILKRMIPGRS